jgi:hypothetical protein
MVPLPEFSVLTVSVNAQFLPFRTVSPADGLRMGVHGWPDPAAPVNPIGAEQ